MKKTNWFLIAGIAYILMCFVVVGSDFGELQEAYVVDWGTMLGGVFATVVPFVVGLLAGKQAA